MLQRNYYNELPQDIADENDKTQPSWYILTILNMTKDTYNEKYINKYICPHCERKCKSYNVKYHINKYCPILRSDIKNIQLMKEDDELVNNDARWLDFSISTKENKWLLLDLDDYNKAKMYPVAQMNRPEEKNILIKVGNESRQLHKYILGVSEDKSIESKGEKYDYRKSMMKVHNTHGQAISNIQQKGAKMTKNNINTMDAQIDHTRKTVYDGKKRFVIRINKKEKNEEQIDNEFQNACAILNQIPHLKDENLEKYIEENNIKVNKQ